MKIDVSKCDYYRFSECYRYDFPLSCAKCSDCYYKQLQQYKQLCKQKTVDNFDLIKQVEKLKQENEELKKQYNCYACGNCNGKEDYINLEKHHIGLRKQYDKYSQCLNEIKEILPELEQTKIPFCTIAEKIRDVIKQAKEG